MNSNEDENPFMTPKEVVAWMKKCGVEVTADTVRNWCLKGLQNKKRPEARYYLRSVWVGGRLQIFRADLVVFAQDLVLVVQGTSQGP